MISQNSLKLLIVGLSSACGLVVEIVAGRMIAPYLGMSLFTWTAVISVVLAGFSVGHWIGGLLAERPTVQSMRSVGWSLLLAALSTMATLVIIRTALPAIIEWKVGAIPTVLLGTLVLFFLPSLFVGIPSPVLTKLAVDNVPPNRAGRTIGAFYAIGAIGSILGTLAAGFIFISWLGTTATLMVVSCIYAASGLSLFLASSTAKLRSLGRPSILFLPPLALLTIIGQSVGAFHDPCLRGSNYYCIRVIDVSHQYGERARVMVLDHLGHGINLERTPRTLVSPYVELQDVLARTHLRHVESPTVFFVGGGAYTLPRAWLDGWPHANIVVAEIDPQVTATAVRAMWLNTSDRLTTKHEDARTALLGTRPGTLDVVVGDAFHDIVIPQHLVTREFFELVASKLRDRGVYMMNVVDHADNPRLMLSIYETMQQVFPKVEIWRPNGSDIRTTFVLAAVHQATPSDTYASRVTRGAEFERLGSDVISTLSRRLRPIILNDDFVPVDRLIGVE